MASTIPGSLFRMISTRRQPYRAADESFKKKRKRLFLHLSTRQQRNTPFCDRYIYSYIQLSIGTGSSAKPHSTKTLSIYMYIYTVLMLNREGTRALTKKKKSKPSCARTVCVYYICVQRFGLASFFTPPDAAARAHARVSTHSRV